MANKVWEWQKNKKKTATCTCICLHATVCTRISFNFFSSSFFLEKKYYGKVYMYCACFVSRLFRSFTSILYVYIYFHFESLLFRVNRPIL